MGTDSAVARETAWLNTISGDSLPFLPASGGGLWAVIDAYVQGAARQTNKPSIYVRRGQVRQVRVANQRVRPRYPVRLELHWPVRVTSPGASSIAATEAQNFDDAIEALRARVTGPMGDKSHGGRFLSAAIDSKGQPDISVDYGDATATIKSAKELTGTMTYYLDDFEISA